jgi:hypothetical protein
MIGGILIARGVMNATQFQSLTDALTTIITDGTVLFGVAAPIVTGVWGMMAHSNKAVVTQAAKLPGVKVLVSDAAPAEVKAVAADPLVKNVTNGTPKP